MGHNGERQSQVKTIIYGVAGNAAWWILSVLILWLWNKMTTDTVMVALCGGLGSTCIIVAICRTYKRRIEDLMSPRLHIVKAEYGCFADAPDYDSKGVEYKNVTGEVMRWIRDDSIDCHLSHCGFNEAFGLQGYLQDRTKSVRLEYTYDGKEMPPKFFRERTDGDTIILP